jgi:hypothetical protein
VGSGGLGGPRTEYRTIRPSVRDRLSTVLDYLGRYTHRVALSNDRILAVQNSQVIFSPTAAAKIKIG